MLGHHLASLNITDSCAILSSEMFSNRYGIDMRGFARLLLPRLVMVLKQHEIRKYKLGARVGGNYNIKSLLGHTLMYSQ